MARPLTRAIAVVKTAPVVASPSSCLVSGTPPRQRGVPGWTFIRRGGGLDLPKPAHLCSDLGVPASSLPLLAVPNVSEGRDLRAVAAIAQAFQGAGGDVRLLDVHSDPDHHRSVITLAGAPARLSAALLAGAREAVRRIDLATERGAHPHVGALDVAPVVHLDHAGRGAACAEALVAADSLACELEVPVFLYGVLAGGRTRAELRRGGPDVLVQRMRSGELRPDFGPRRPHPTAGVTLVAARPPLVAFNLELAPPAGIDTALAIARRVREGGADGLPGLRAMGVALVQGGGRAQVSMNVEDPVALPLAAVVGAVGAHARIARAELVGLAPRAALEGFPADLEIVGFDPARQVIEDALGL
jgi:glutamate formiminotransferase/glutamate formiminotransferase/formiminotetrahydrofolate cyclodeaminase